MKNKKLATGVLGTALALLMLAGCETKDQKLVRGFAEWMAKKADDEAKAKFNKNYVYDTLRDDTWLKKAENDSIRYRNALARDADIVLEYVDKCHSANEVWAKIQNTPVAREYGPGSFINENGDWEYGDHVDNGYDKVYKLKVNHREYTRTLKDLYRLRSARARCK